MNRSFETSKCVSGRTVRGFQRLVFLETIENCDIDVTKERDDRTMKTLSEYGSSETRHGDRTTINPGNEKGTCAEQLRTVKQDGAEEDRDRRRAGTSKQLDATT